MTDKIRVLVTGSSGLLGRAFMRTFAGCADKFNVLGLAFSRYEKYKNQFPLEHVDINDRVQLTDIVNRFKPDVIIHSAAERRPDICENDKDRVIQLNVKSTEFINELAMNVGAYLVLISSDYVFDGENAPYKTDAQTNPLSFYGETKRASEVVCLKNPRNIILRVPVLYGQVETLSESAVTVVAEQIKKNANVEIDNWQLRYPTLVDDVAKCTLMLICKKKENGDSISGIYHFTDNQKLTKYEMAVVMAKVLGIDASQIKPGNSKPSGAPRPYNAQLDTTATSQLIGVLPSTNFETAITSILNNTP
ncbi:methionine adenosyltransferase regulatory beta subunit [Heterostelium album PN500]|uniref:Methionine adenosyltransferase regulatory beta subunit n=1 Tax=Heterostelium pallidum (strain ATCC 26659 / Pp 5 / PN500) TaxID=670386 RepID=D3BIW4_HETP5|nr:methionine adenosyltransferase regulatory beta subunit [Heterostelium album PN500]EFA78738.1 methionine adenosyltransferase regulatory beta subunit [Heterostelium album PN500]|eukprot:XP_020430862.1 methionine adenosyltransferase regulatory beta subunit [Heterostelium album PN500]